MDTRTASELAERVTEQLRTVVVGQDEVLDQMTITLLAGGHGLIEGVPGTAKTLSARALALVTGCGFRRIQFTPDLMPSDILGINIYNTSTGQFSFREGPIFTDLVLADEINRAPAKTQSALLEAMQEKQTTIDGTTRPLSEVFTVFATQNPIEFEGTYPLPEAEVDRFMLKILIDYPSGEAEAGILDRAENGFDAARIENAGLDSILDLQQLSAIREAIRQIHMEESVRRYTTAIVRATRTLRQTSLGASPRAGVMLMRAAKAHAVIRGRDFVTPDDVKEMALPALRHRIMLLPEMEVEGLSPDTVLSEMLTRVEAPRR